MSGGGFDAAATAARIADLLPSERPIALHEPRFGKADREYVLDCVDSGWVSYLGQYVDRLEQHVAEWAGTRHAVAMVNGTAALRIALQVAGVRSDDEVLVPDLTFVATLNAASNLGAVPHLIDAEPASLGICPAALADRLSAVAEREADGTTRNRETGRRISAIIPMHVFGMPSDMDALCAVAERWGLVIVEDAAEAVGSTYRGRRAGSFGLVSAFSFNGNKPVTSGGGGAVATDDEDLARRAKHLTTQAKVPHRWAFVHDEIASNDRMPNLNAALGCAQYERLSVNLAAKRRLWQRYRDGLADVPGLEILDEPEGCRSNHWLVTALAPDLASREALLSELHDRQILARPIWAPMQDLVIYDHVPRGDLSTSRSLADRIISLPSSPFLDPDWPGTEAEP